MKKYYYTLIVAVFFNLLVNAQVTYSDQFDGFNSAASNSGYDVSVENSNLKAVGNGTAGAYQAFQYNIHNSGNLTTLDMTSNTQVFIKARANGPGVLRIDLKDAAGFITNQSAKYASLKEDYAIYTLDFSGAFNDGGFGGSPCESANSPCPVNPANIANMFFYVDDADGGYAGTLEIDWISVGEPLEVVETVSLYQDQFEANLTTASNSAYTSTLSNGNLKIVANGTAGAYNSFLYNLHNAGTEINADVSELPTIYIKAKANNRPTFRVDMIDSRGFATNAKAVSAAFTDEFAIYELKFEGKFEDGGFGGTPCEVGSGPCSVDATSISNLAFYVDDATGGYEGTIEIDWLSIGEPVEASLPRGKNIRYNQVGYHLDREKLINVTADDNFNALPYTVTNANGANVMSGNTTVPQLWSESGEYVATIDVTSINTVGTYTLTVEGKSIDFKVSEDTYKALSEAAFKYYYFNRASTAITPEFGGVFARPTGLADTEIYVHSSAASAARPEGTVISAPKGWYDAGDYNKYIVNSGISTYTLLAAFEHYPNVLKTKAYDIPEKTNNIPDLLDEVKWNLDWMLDMQDPNDGGVYHKLTGLNFEGIILPDAYTARRYVVQKSTGAALNFAAVTAMASRIYADYEAQLPGYSAQLLEASKEAYSWAKANPTAYYRQPSDVVTGEYGDNNVTDEFQWAAVELFITTKDSKYGNDISVNSIDSGIPFWNQSNPLALISIVTHADELASSINVNTAKSNFLATANELTSKVNGSPMRVAMGTNDFDWGSNGQASNQLMVLLTAYKVDGNESYLNAAYTASDYLLGRNATGYCFVSGFGDLSMNNPHHRISEGDTIKDAIPGMLAGGPHSGQQDKCSGYPSDLPARSYVDTWCSFSSNEVTINWNAPLFYSTVALSTIEEQASLSTNAPEVTKKANALSVFPNPANEFINIKLDNATSAIVNIYAMDGKLVLATNLDTSKPLNISTLTKGMYFVKVFSSKSGNHVAKFIKN